MKKKRGSLPGRRPPYGEDGVDLTLIRWMLSLTPAERLDVLQQAVHSILGLRKGLTDNGPLGDDIHFQMIPSLSVIRPYSTGSLHHLHFLKKRPREIAKR